MTAIWLEFKRLWASRRVSKLLAHLLLVYVAGDVALAEQFMGHSMGQMSIVCALKIQHLNNHN